MISVCPLLAETKVKKIFGFKDSSLYYIFLGSSLCGFVNIKVCVTWRGRSVFCFTRVQLRITDLPCTHLFFFWLLLCKSILFIENYTKRLSKLRRCFLITQIIGGTYGAEGLQLLILLQTGCSPGAKSHFTFMKFSKSEPRIFVSTRLALQTGQAAIEVTCINSCPLPKSSTQSLTCSTGPFLCQV